MNLTLIGLLDSPYVRRVAIALQFMELDFQHRPVSVFSQQATFAEINPVVKAPSLVCDDGTVLMDSGLMLQFAALLSPNAWASLPNHRKRRAQVLRLEGLALAVMEKAVQMVYETQLRPPERQHEAWRARVAIQLTEALRLLEAQLQGHRQDLQEQPPCLAEVSAAVAWTFCRQLLPQLVEEATCPGLHRFTQQAEALPAFRRAPHSEGQYPCAG